MHLSPLQWFPVGLTFSLQVAILVLMVRRGLRSSFPWFFGFVCFSAFSIPLKLVSVAFMSQVAYAYIYWIIAGLSAILAFAIMREAFIHVLKPYSALVDLGKLLFRWALVFLALVSLVTALATVGSCMSRTAAAIFILQRSSQLMLSGLLLLFVLFESRLGLSWRSPAICIILGFGTNAAFSLVRRFTEERLSDWGNQMDMVGALICVAVYGVWLVSLTLPHPSRRTVQDSPTRLILQRWNEALLATPLGGRGGEVITMTPIESFLPGVERTVERVMARKMMN